MRQRQLRERRVVTRAEYLRRMASALGLSALGLSVFTVCVAIVALIWIVPSVLAWDVHGYGSHAPGHRLFLLPVTTVLAAVGVYCSDHVLPHLWRRGESYIKRAREQDTVEPLTRHNAARLAAAESLVRPVATTTGNTALLLRSAHHGQRDPEEQLLRPPASTV